MLMNSSLIALLVTDATEVPYPQRYCGIELHNLVSELAIALDRDTDAGDCVTGGHASEELAGDFGE